MASRLDAICANSALSCSALSCRFAPSDPWESCLKLSTKAWFFSTSDKACWCSKPSFCSCRRAFSPSTLRSSSAFCRALRLTLRASTLASLSLNWALIWLISAVNASSSGLIKRLLFCLLVPPAKAPPGRISEPSRVTIRTWKRTARAALLALSMVSKIAVTPRRFWKILDKRSS